MSQTKVQLIQPVGIVTAPGVNVSGTLTATTFDGNLTGDASSLVGSPNLNVGFITATSFVGNGENLTGIAGSTFIGVVTAAQSGTTTIDLSLGNIIYFTQDTNTTVAFANTESVQVLDFIRAKDDTTTARTITWPDSIIWNGGTAPTLIDSSDANDVQIFKLITRDQGVTWYGYEAMQSDPAEPPEPYYAMGDNLGRYGDNSIITRSSPHQIAGGINWASFGGNYYTTIATKTDGTLWAWGNGTQGALGQNNENEVPRSSPIQIPGTQWSTVSRTLSNYAHFAIKTDGTLWCWGSSVTGSHGQNNTNAINYSSPVQIPGTQWSYVDGGWMYFNKQTVLGRKTDNTLWVWGGHSYGSSGLNSASQDIGSPTQLPGTWVKSSSAGYNQYGLNSSGQLYSWGYSLQGQGGRGNSTTTSSPQAIGGTQWTNVYTMKRTTYATKTDGTLWAWGQNTYGELGQNDRTQRNSPVQLPGTQWDKVINNNSRTSVVARKTDGTLWGWGQNSSGVLGQNNTVVYSSPVQLPGTWNGPFGCSGVGGGPIFLIP